ncbi:sirohydrochlorin chelatase [Virgibacillus ainsalahensis]
MQGILYVSHGSRIKEATSEAIACIDSVRKQVDVALQEICFLELAEPNVEQGIERLAKQGATRISIVPVLLLSAGHYFKDIPEEVDKAKVNYPTIIFTYGQPLGVQDRFTTVLAERIKETGVHINQDARILLVGRGSRNPQTKVDIENIGGKLQERMNIPVDVCYLAACEPSFEHGLLSALKDGSSQVFIAPYLWFTGVLMQHVERKISTVTQREKEIIVCGQLGDHPVMQAALQERVYESYKRRTISA